MKKINLLVIALIVAITVNAQNAVPSTATVSTSSIDASSVKAVAPAEDVMLLKETEFDFGKVPQGKPVTHIFEFTNKGKDSLNIVNVQASCGCTTPEWEKDKAIAPGGISKITVGFNAAAEGPFTKYITITYNGTLSKQILIKGEVWKTPVASAPENKGLNELKN